MVVNANTVRGYISCSFGQFTYGCDKDTILDPNFDTPSPKTAVDEETANFQFNVKYKTPKVFLEAHSFLFDQDRTLFFVPLNRAIQVLFNGTFT